MKVRTITAAIIIAAAIPIIVFSQYLVYPIILGILSCIAVFEMFRVLGIHKVFAISVPAYLMAAALPVASYFVTADTRLLYILGMMALIFAYMLYAMSVSVFSKGKLSMSKVAEAFMGVNYIIVSFTSLSIIRYIDHGLFCFCLVFVIAWVCDCMAYLVGTFIGKHKLIPDVSPKKTVEGAIGGVIGGGIACALYGLIVELVSEAHANYLTLVIMGLVLSVVSQIGDLIASLIKREHNIKDYGNVLPGHGGIMDRFDSVLAIATPLVVACLVFPPFT